MWYRKSWTSNHWKKDMKVVTHPFQSGFRSSESPSHLKPNWSSKSTVATDWTFHIFNEPPLPGRTHRPRFSKGCTLGIGVERQAGVLRHPSLSRTFAPLAEPLLALLMQPGGPPIFRRPKTTSTLGITSANPIAALRQRRPPSLPPQ
jgi:hypothetical protein